MRESALQALRGVGQGQPPICCLALGFSGLTGLSLPCPGTSPEGPLPGGGEEDEDADAAVELPEPMAPDVPPEPQEPRSPQQVGALRGLRRPHTPVG